MWGTVMIKFRFALALAAGAAMLAPLSQPASAADMGGGGGLKDTPYVVVPSWGGLYFGGHAGGAWGNTSGSDTFTYVGDPTVPLNFNSTGFIGGAQAGYNVQRGHVVFGLEGDIGYLGISASKSEKGSPTQGECWENYGPSDPHHGITMTKRCVKLTQSIPSLAICMGILPAVSATLPSAHFFMRRAVPHS